MNKPHYNLHKSKFTCGMCKKIFEEYTFRNPKCCSHRCASLLKTGKPLQCSTKFKVGHNPWNTNLPVHLSPKTEFKKGMIPWNKGLRVSLWEEYKCVTCGKIFSDYSSKKRKMCSARCVQIMERERAFTKGFTPWNKGKPFPQITGNKHHAWHGGISKEGYPHTFNKALKASIRQRDNYKCQLCGCPQLEHPTKLIIHHIDYNKENCSQKNLVTLCNSCNSKVNFKRKEWIKYFQTISREGYEKSITGSNLC